MMLHRSQTQLIALQIDPNGDNQLISEKAWETANNQQTIGQVVSDGQQKNHFRRYMKSYDLKMQIENISKHYR